MKKRTAELLTLILLMGILSGCAVSGGDDSFLVSADETYETTGDSGDDYNYQDNKSLYEEDDENEVITMYLTVGRGNEEDGTDHTWTEVNSHPLTYYEEQGIQPYKCEAVLQVGDETGPVEGEFGSRDRAANATVQLRGEGASSWQQKSYRIKIKDGSGDWRDQKTISLNKHVSDPVRFKNRLAYSLMEEIPQMFSARTTFVHLYVKDKTEGENGLFRDYGLYTQVEQVNKTYLKNRGLDNGGALYQAAGHFDWQRHEDSILTATDENYDREKFEEYLEIDGSEEHDKIVELLGAVNDMDVPVSDIVSQYFDSENLYYWMAFHILMGNKDVLDGNYYLYSARGSDRWYFISWDNDSILEEGYEIMDDAGYERSWNKGVFTFADTVLFKRILQDEICRQTLDAAVEDLKSSVLTEETLRQKIDAYRAVTEQYLYSLPDQTYTRVSEENYDILADSMAGEVTENYEAYKESMESAWPFHIFDPVNENGKTVLSWEESYVQDGSDVTYTIELAKDYSFEDCIVNTQTGDIRYEMEELPEGQYFVRIRAAGSSGLIQDAYEYYRTEWGTTSYSTLCFYVMDDGTVAARRYSEDG